MKVTVLCLPRSVSSVKLNWIKYSFELGKKLFKISYLIIFTVLLTVYSRMRLICIKELINIYEVTNLDHRFFFTLYSVFKQQQQQQQHFNSVIGVIWVMSCNFGSLLLLNVFLPIFCCI